MNGKNKPVGEFEEEGILIRIFAKKDEEPAVAIERAAKRHDIPARAIKKLTNTKEETKEEK